MIETERGLAVRQSRPEFVYEEQFFDRVFLGCFVNKVYVVIKQRTLYLYHSRNHYQDNPTTPYMFFSINHMNSTLTQDSVQISNGFTETTLKHDNPDRLLDLLEAINKGRLTIGPEDLYPKKFVYLDSMEFKSEE